MFRSPLTSTLRASARAFSTSPIRRGDFASTTFIGRIGTDLSPTEASTGKKYLRYNLAVQQRKDSPTSWFPIVVFNENQVNFMSEYIKKG